MMFVLRYWKLIGTALIVAGLLTYGLRNDHLRAGYKARLDTIRIAFKDIGYKKLGDDDLAPNVNRLAAERNLAKTERDQERAANDIMADSVRRAAAETEQAMQAATDAHRRIAQLTKERNQWIEKARSAATRTERMSAELEVAECVAALSELRSAGF
jgi:hypothetical protein